jgi:hypothetical protein
MHRRPPGCYARRAGLPTPVWGRDELSVGEMWNSNSVTSWLLERSGLDANAITPPPRGEGPRWRAGARAARRAADSDLIQGPRAEGRTRELERRIEVRPTFPRGLR